MPDKGTNCAEQAAAYQTLIDAAEKIKQHLPDLRTDKEAKRLALLEKKSFEKAYSVILLRRKHFLERRIENVRRRGKIVDMSIMTAMFLEREVEALKKVEKKLASLHVDWK